MENKIYSGSSFPDPITQVKITFSKELLNEYLPAWKEVFKSDKKGLALLCCIMAHKEGFFAGSRSYRLNNPGNIGNTDNGSNSKQKTLTDGIRLQRDYILKISAGKHNAYPLNKEVFLKPYYSEEIANNQKNYGGMSPWVPGYKFKYTGKLEQFVKIYSTGARSGNKYLSMIISYFKNHGYEIHPETTIAEIINLD